MLFFRTHVSVHCGLLLLFHRPLYGDQNKPPVGGHPRHIQGEDGLCYSQCYPDQHQECQIYFHHLCPARLHLHHTEQVQLVCVHNARISLVLVNFLYLKYCPEYKSNGVALYNFFFNLPLSCEVVDPDQNNYLESEADQRFDQKTILKKLKKIVKHWCVNIVYWYRQIG